MKNEIENLISEFQKANGHLVSLTEAALSGFIADRHLHARFLNTLSMLEQRGSHISDRQCAQIASHQNLNRQSS